MTLFSKLYSRVLEWAKHKHAGYYLAGVSFAESSIFPIPPDVLLAPMALARPAKAWKLALITTLASVLGGIVGYLIGYYAFELLGQHFINFFNLTSAYEKTVNAFTTWGFWVVFVSALTPLPYKLFTQAAGVAAMPVFPFVIASIMGRGSRFFLVAGFARYAEGFIEKKLVRFLDKAGWVVLVLILVGLVLYQVLK